MYQGDNPPEFCPRCGSEKAEFDLMPVEPGDERAKKLKPADFLLINGSIHRHHNTGLFLDTAAEVFAKEKQSFQIVHLTEFRIDPCWHCYSMQEKLCRVPCQNQDDDMKFIYPLLLNCKGFIVASPVNWNNMSAILKHFLDRLTAIENMSSLNGSMPMLGKACGILINGHEDGAYKTALDIFMYLENLGCVLAPYGIMYGTHGQDFLPETDKDFFVKNETVKHYIKAVANNVIELTKAKIDFSKFVSTAK
ncbi:MAG: flavodoxin family protein [Patescibacteria group bacterium]|nr:flavodoxin family protein [Patescibacteria group bacterium]